MKKITLSETDLSEMITFYTQELEKSRQRINHLESILKKLLSKEEETIIPISKAKEDIPVDIPVLKKRGRKPKVVVPVEKVIVPEPEKIIKTRGRKPKSAEDKVTKPESPKKAKAPRGRKPKPQRIKWTNFVVDTLMEKDSLLLANSLTNIAMEKFRIHESLSEKTRLAVANCLARLTNVEKKIRTYSIKEIRGNFYGLPQWFDETGVLKEDYTKKLK